MTTRKDLQRGAGIQIANRLHSSQQALQQTTASGNSNPTLPRLMTEARVADDLNISPRTLQQWRYRGAGPRFIKVGSAVRYRPEDIAAWLEDQTRVSTSDPGPEAA